VSLHLAPDLKLPADAITQTFGVLAVRGAGKSNLAAVMAEEMHKARLPFVVVDPVGSWWGLRSSGDGGHPGMPIPIFGGRHGDVPLEETGGQVIADLVVDERVSCVLDVSELSEGAKTRFLIDFGERLYRRNSEPLHLFLEEADDYCPQKPFREQARLLRVWENIVRRGRARGLGITLITQRSAALNKNVLTQVETLFVLRTTSPQDRKAIEAWIQFHGQARDILETLDKLAPGEAWCWSPAWLRTMKRVQIRRRATFDSGATPKNVRGARPAATLADVDLGKVRAKMAATIERAKAEDPKELRRKIAELERAVKAAHHPGPVKVERVEVPVIDVKRLEQIGLGLHQMNENLQAMVRGLRSMEQDLEGAAAKFDTARRIASSHSPAPAMHQRLGHAGRPRKRGTGVDAASPASGNGQDKLGKAHRLILTALARYPDGKSRKQLGPLTGYRSDAGHFGNLLGDLRGHGHIEGESSLLRITPEGLAALGPYEPLPEPGPELIDYWTAKLGAPEAKILIALVASYPGSLSRSQLGDATGYRADAGHFGNLIGKLRGLDLITGPSSALRASEDLVG